MLQRTNQLSNLVAARIARAVMMLSCVLSWMAFVPSDGWANAPAGATDNLPRFVSLKASRVNLRKGPGTEYPTAWVFRRAGLPVEIVREYQLWREVRDAEGTTGWVLHSLLSARRTGQVAPWDAGKTAAGSEELQVPILSRKSDTARRVVIVEPGVITDLHACDGIWCRVSVAGYTGFIRQNKLWGIYPNETLE